MPGTPGPPTETPTRPEHRACGKPRRREHPSNPSHGQEVIPPCRCRATGRLKSGPPTPTGDGTYSLGSRRPTCTPLVQWDLIEASLGGVRYSSARRISIPLGS